jgi:hypothetical protein
LVFLLEQALQMYLHKLVEIKKANPSQMEIVESFNVNRSPKSLKNNFQ